MADTILTDLGELTVLASGDQLYVVDVSDTTMAASGTSKRVSYDTLYAAVRSGLATSASLADYLTSATAATTYQPLDTDLTALAGLASAADRLPYFTGSGTAALATFTAAGREILDDADAAAQRTTLGLGSLATASTINGGNWSGADLAVADGGTGASDAATARTNLSAAARSQTFAIPASIIGTLADGTYLIALLP